jgi:peptidoglycan/xylan/chitin deacetylase (PgdA/CDA1 family)
MGRSTRDIHVWFRSVHPSSLQRWSWHVVPQIHPILQRYFPQALWAGSSQERCIALTFDDGPDLRDTPALLDVLARHGVRATFFWLGERGRHALNSFP